MSSSPRSGSTAPAWRCIWRTRYREERVHRRDDARVAFISDVVAPTLRYPTEDMSHYARFASRLRALHALARELAGDTRLFSG